MTPRKEKQFEEIRQKSKANILKAAFELFALNGYHATSISKIAVKAGISKGLIYNYFDSKEMLLDEIVTSRLNEIVKLTSLLETKDPYKRLETLIRTTFEMLKTQKEYWRFYTSIIMQIDVIDTIRSKITQSFEMLIREIQEIFKAMGVKDPELEAYKFGGMIDGICLHCAVFFEDTYPADKVMESMIKQYCQPKKSRK